MMPHRAAGDNDVTIEGPQLIARVTATDDGRTRCTIHPETTTDWRDSTRWISADEGSYVGLEAVD